MSLSYQHQQHPNRLETIICVIQEEPNMGNDGEQMRKNKAHDDVSQDVGSI